MWDGLGMLLVLSITMAVASFLAGSLPLSFTLSPRQMRLLTACGTGVLVGTSLIVIIPEGVETLYSAKPGAHQHPSRSLSLQTRHAAVGYHFGLDGPTLETPTRAQALYVRFEDISGGMTGPDDGRPTSPEDAAEDGVPAKPDLDNSEGTEKTPVDDHQDAADFEPHAWIGLSIILGFILMYLVDQLPKLASSGARMRPAYISLDRLGLNRRPSEGTQDVGDDDVDHSAGPKFLPSSTTTGLVIHAAADGIALGASSAGTSRNLGFIIFLALMIHKAPAAFGLTAVLLKQGLSKRRARTHLIIFSLAAPAGALATWAAAGLLGDEGDTSTEFATGLLLLFSGGTFLYVAMHTMQENGHSHSTTKSTSNGYADPYQQQSPEPDGPNLVDMLVTVGGMLLPLVTQVGHAH